MAWLHSSRPGRVSLRRVDWPVTYSRKVRYSDTDAQGIVFNGNYLRYYDDAITDLFDAAGLDEPTLHDMGCDVLTVHAEVDFKATAGLGELLVTGVRVQRLGTSSITFALESRVGDRVTSTGKVVFVCVDPATHTPMPLPDPLMAAFESIHEEALR